MKKNRHVIKVIDDIKIMLGKEQTKITNWEHETTLNKT